MKCTVYVYLAESKLYQRVKAVKDRKRPFSYQNTHKLVNTLRLRVSCGCGTRVRVLEREKQA